MKTKPALLLSLMLGVQGSFAGQGMPWSASALLGVGFAPKMHFDYTDAVTATSETNLLNLQTGYNLGLALGYRTDFLQYELEWMRTRNCRRTLLNTTNVLIPDSNGDIRVNAALVNVYYHFTIGDSRVVPYAGAGVGVAGVRTQINTATIQKVVSGSERVFVYQGIIGAHYQITPRVATFMDYRYLDTNDTSFTTIDTETAAVHPNSSSNFRSHGLNIGLKCYF